MVNNEFNCILQSMNNANEQLQPNKKANMGGVGRPPEPLVFVVALILLPRLLTERLRSDLWVGVEKDPLHALGKPEKTMAKLQKRAYVTKRMKNF